MLRKRVIARLDVKPPNLVKGVQLEGLRKLGNPLDFAKKYYAEGIDEIIYLDIVASLYERNGLFDLIAASTQDIFVPLTVGGGIRSLEDVKNALNAGADKVAINTAALKNPDIITQVSKTYGSQCMVLSIEAKRDQGLGWEALYDNGREHSYRSVIEWAKEGERLGAGEILLTSIDCEGTAKGFDWDLVRQVTEAVSIPVIASGGAGCLEDIIKISPIADAIAVANLLHYNKASVSAIQSALVEEVMATEECLA